MQIRAQDTTREQREGVSNVANSMPRNRAHVLPIRSTRREHLQPTKPIMEKRERAKIGVRAYRGFLLRCLGIYSIASLGWILDAACLRATWLVERMQREERSGRKTKLLFKHGKNSIVHVQGLLHKRLDRRFHAGIDRGRIRAVDHFRIRQRVVLGDVDELYCIKVTIFIRRICARGFVPIALASRFFS